MGAYTRVTGTQPDLSKMMMGDPVLEMQKLLDKHCFGPEQDGYFGDKTERCLNEFKSAYNMTADGICDSYTWSVLNGPAQMITRHHGTPHVHAGVLNWTAENIGCPTVPAYTTISQCWAFERNNVTNLSYAYDFGPTIDMPIGTTEPFAIDLLTLFPNDGQYTAVMTVGTTTEMKDYDVVNGHVVHP
jgi:hypothetical protein